MKINQIIVKESMGGVTAGAIATVESPLGGTQKRNNETVNVPGLKPVSKLGKSKKKGPYQNSLVEGAMKDIDVARQDYQRMSPQQFFAAYKMTKQQWYEKNKQFLQKPVKEAELQEDDLVIIPGQGMKRKTGFVPKGQSRVDHEVEMARSDVLATMKNAKAIYKLLQDRSEDEGIEGWVQEKLIKANDYLNAVKEYYDEKMMQEMTGGVIAGGGVGEAYDPTTDRFFRPNSEELRKQRRAERTAGQPVKPSNPPQPVKKKPMTPFGPGQQKVNEKFASQQQAKLMYATAGGADTGVSKKVAKEFIKKSHGQKVSNLPKKVGKKGN